ncbi:MAG: anaerobic ribonucleoside-triphosphate reductase [bacterium]|nr:anaerobic ribonucleoside-triphosphate reductase [bacterium]
MELATNVKNNCHDCGEKIEIKGKEIKNGLMLVYDNLGEKINIYKCNQCFKNNPSLANFRKCEVYSRIVGYLRPVRQWHVGKKQEFKERKEFKCKQIEN